MAALRRAARKSLLNNFMICIPELTVKYPRSTANAHRMPAAPQFVDGCRRACSPARSVVRNFSLWYLLHVPAIPSLRRLLGTVFAVVACACSNPTPSGYQGYVEGEFVNVASPIAGRLDELSVKRGDSVALNA